jgi:hypothetical protein
MMRRKLWLLTLLLLLISAGVVLAGSSANFVVHRSVLLSGGSAESANYTVDAVIGQPVTGKFDSANYDSTAGFLFPIHNKLGGEVLLPVILR